jgi:peptidoglycan/xylan/chitin deacetylase (PgdA/CDA1 family)
MWKDLLLSTYYHTTLPLRRISTTRAMSRGVVPISILFFHRIADEDQNPWTMPCEMFARQVEWLKQHFDLISLAEAQRRLTSGISARPAVCITFDDGYGENCAFAIPLLVKEQIPCTYFVASKFILEG